MSIKDSQRCSIRDIPDANSVVATTARQQFAVGVERDIGDVVLMSPERCSTEFSALGIPQLDQLVVGTARQQVTVRVRTGNVSSDADGPAIVAVPSNNWCPAV